MAASGSATNDITIPGGIKVFFNDGTGERDLGNVVGDSMTFQRDPDTLEHFTNRSGKRQKDKTFIIEESLQADFEVDEINVINLQYFFGGQTVNSTGAGTAAIVDQKETLTGTQLISVEKPGLTAVSVRQFLDNVYMFDGTTFTDHSIEADSAAGTPFAINADADDVLYCGKATKFQELDIDIAVASAGYTADTWEYWNGAAWTTLTMTGTDDFSVDATLTFTPPVDWVQATINGVTQYYIRFTQTAAAPTAATLNSIGRQILVANTDYLVDPGNPSDGRIARIASAALVAGEEVKVSFTYVTFTYQSFGVATAGFIEGSARLEVTPSSGRGRTWHYVIPRAQIANNGNMDLDDSDFQTIPLSLVVLDNSACDPVNPLGEIRHFPLV